MSKQNLASFSKESRDAAWSGKTESAFRAAQERDTDIAYSRRMEALDRVKKYGIKLGAKFRGQLIGKKRDPRLVHDYEVVKIDKEKGVVFLQSKQEEKMRRVTFLHNIFGPRQPRGARRNLK